MILSLYIRKTTVYQNNPELRMNKLPFQAKLYMNPDNGRVHVRSALSDTNYKNATIKNHERAFIKYLALCNGSGRYLVLVRVRNRNRRFMRVVINRDRYRRETDNDDKKSYVSNYLPTERPGIWYDL